MIFWATHYQNLEILRLFFDHGASTADIWKEINWAKSGKTTEWDTKAAKLLLSRTSIKKIMSSSATDRDTLMNVAVLCGAVSFVKQILEAGSHEDTRPWSPRTFLHDECYNLRLPLACAAKWGHMDVVALMLDYDGGPSARTQWSGALKSAVLSGDIDMVRLLLDRGIGIDFQREESYFGVDVLRYAARFPSIFQLLIHRGAFNLETYSCLLESLMRKVVKSGNMTLLKILLDKGVLLEMETLLLEAAQGSSDTLEFLSPYGVVTFHPRVKPSYLLNEFDIRNCNLGVLDFFLKAGYGSNASMAFQTAATSVTDHKVTIQIFDTLLRHGLDLREMEVHCDHCSQSPYRPCSCKEEEQVKVVQYLLKKGANPQPMRSKWARSVLQQAENRKSKKLGHLILQAIVDTPGISPDKIKANLDFASAKRLLGWKSWSRRLVDDYYWRKIYPVP